jgi:multiple sugar transport system ATP-binding protein
VAQAAGGASELIVGIRPEHVTVSDAGGDGLAAEVVLVESLGADSYVHATLAGIDATFVARTEGYDVRQPGTNIRLRLDPDRIYGFDAQTEERLGDRHATSPRPNAVGAAGGAGQ